MDTLNIIEITIAICSVFAAIASIIAFYVQYKKSKLEAEKFFSLGRQYSPRKVVRVVEPKTGETEFHVVEANQISDYSESPSPSPEVPYPPGSGWIIDPNSMWKYSSDWKYQVVSSGIYNPHQNLPQNPWLNPKPKVDEGNCPFCHQRKDLTKNFCPHCGGSYA